MNSFRIRLLIVMLWTALTASIARAERGGVEHLTRDEFQSLAAELSQKVTLFQDVWEKDPSAQFFGGTTRDFLYWVRGKFITARSRSEALEISESLKRLPVIDVKEFIIGESDVDVVSNKSLNLTPQFYGIRKIDSISGKRFDPSTAEGKDELAQGHIPAEKIRLGKTGFISWDGVGDGLAEIHHGKVTVQFPEAEAFASTAFAKSKINHPVLLALRYLRLAAINYYKIFGNGHPDRSKLFDLDPTSSTKAMDIIQRAVASGELDEYLKKEKFVEWINGTIRKAFLSYTNPTAAKLLFDRFGVLDLISRYPMIGAYNQYVFAKSTDAEKLVATLTASNITPEALYQPITKYFPDGKLYHGTKSDSAYRAILFQGALPSEKGTAGEGLYGVGLNDVDFAEEWSGLKGDEKDDRVVQFQVNPNAKVIDIKEGPGKTLFDAFEKTYMGKRLFEDFADSFGADILRYDYHRTAFVVKNSEALLQPQGRKIQLLTFPQILAKASTIRNEEELTDYLRLLSFNYLSDRELRLALNAISDHSHKVSAARSKLAKFMFPEGDPVQIQEELLRYLPFLLSRNSWRDAKIGDALAKFGAKSTAAYRRAIAETIAKRPEIFLERICSETSDLTNTWYLLPNNLRLRLLDGVENLLSRKMNTLPYLRDKILHHAVALGLSHENDTALKMAALSLESRLDLSSDANALLGPGETTGRALRKLVTDTNPEVRARALDHWRARYRRNKTYLSHNDSSAIVAALLDPGERTQEAALNWFSKDGGITPAEMAEFYSVERKAEVKQRLVEVALAKKGSAFAVTLAKALKDKLHEAPSIQLLVENELASCPDLGQLAK